MEKQGIEMTQKEYEKAKERLQYLKTVKRREIIERIAKARQFGDLSENPEYDDARRVQAKNGGAYIAGIVCTVFL